MSRPRQWDAEYASIFNDESVVRAYRHRPPYPSEVFEILASLIDDEPQAVLDTGCGTGFIARTLVQHVHRLDALDVSQAMIETGRNLPGGDDPRLRWICGPIETVSLHSPYALIVAASSLHWMEWDVVLPRFREMLSPKGYLALVEEIPNPNPWDEEVGEILNLDHRRFRANIYLDSEDGEGFGEDRFVGKSLRIGEKAVVAIIERDPRCKMISLDPDTGEHDPNVLRKVAQSHDNFAGVYCAVLVEGTVRKGDAIELVD